MRKILFSLGLCINLFAIEYVNSSDVEKFTEKAKYKIVFKKHSNFMEYYTNDFDLGKSCIHFIDYETEKKILLCNMETIIIEK